MNYIYIVALTILSMSIPSSYASDAATPRLQVKNESANQELSEQFTKALNEGDITQLTALLNTGNIDLNNPIFVKSANITPLMWFTQNPAIVQLFLQHNAHLSPITAFNRNVLYAAIGNAMNSKDFRAVNIILDAAENDAVTKSDPAFNRQLFFNEHSKPLLKIASGGNTPNWHSTPDELAVVQRLISNGTDINDTDQKGYTALIYAAKNGNTPLVTFLLNQKGIDTSLKTKDTNQSVYDVAVDNSSIQKLLHAFAKKQLKDQSFIAQGPTDIIADYLHEGPRNRTAIQQSSDPKNLINDDDLEGLAAWISEQKKNNPRFDINAAIDEWTEPLLIVATRANRPEIAGFLLNTMGVNTRAQGFDKMTALHIAAKQGLPTIVDLIIKADYANPKTINAEAANYLTPLLVVAKEGLDGGMAAATLLVDAGANVNARDFDGYTPLMYAALSKKYPLIELLLAHGARANDTRVSRTGPQSALDYIPDTAENAAMRTVLKKHMATQTTQKSKNAKKRKSSDS